MSQSSDNPFQPSGSDDELPQFQEESRPKASSSSAGADLSSLSGKQARLAELRRKEEELLEKKRKLEQTKGEIVLDVNWPPFYPIIRYAPETEIPASAKKCVQFSLYGLASLFVSVCYNVIAVICVKGLPRYPKSRCLIFAIIQGYAAMYFAYNFSFSKLYNSCRKKEVPFSWTIYHFILVAWLVYLTIGFPTSGSVGIATLLDIIAIGKSPFSALVAAINTAIVGISLACQFFTLMGAQAYQRVSGVEDQTQLNPSQFQ